MKQFIRMTILIGAGTMWAMIKNWKWFLPKIAFFSVGFAIGMAAR